MDFGDELSGLMTGLVKLSAKFVKSEVDILPTIQKLAVFLEGYFH